MEPPPALTTHTGKISAIERPPQGRNFDVVIVTAARGRFVCKTGDTEAKIKELAEEAGVLTALADCAATEGFAPRFVAREGDYFLFTCIEGTNLAVVTAQAAGDPARRLRLMAEFGAALRVIHGWTPAAAAFPRPDDWLTETADRCVQNVAAGWTTGTLAHHSIFDGRDAADVAEEIKARRGEYENDIVFCHGDWCLPNALVRDDVIVGAIDWSGGGWADRRFDLATALWTIRYNVGDDPAREAYLRAFLQAYGYPGGVDSLNFFEALYTLF